MSHVLVSDRFNICWCNNLIHDIMENSILEARLKGIEEGLRLNKKVFNTTDLHRYTKLSKSTIYKLTSRGKIPHYCLEV